MVKNHNPENKRTCEKLMVMKYRGSTAQCTRVIRVTQYTSMRKYVSNLQDVLRRQPATIVVCPVRLADSTE